MAKLVIELQKDCVNPTISYGALFQKAYFIAQKLNQQTMVDFLKNEIDGYEKANDVPNFRHIDVTYKAKNHGLGRWIPVSIPCNSPLIKFLKYPIFQSVSEMESFLSSKNDTLVMSISAELQELFWASSRDKIPFEISAHFSKNQFKRILETAKRMISDWAIELENKNILGEEYLFTQKEKDDAKNMTIIINGSVNGSNIIASMANSSATINNNNGLDFESLKQLVTQICNELVNARNADSQKIDDLKSQIAELNTAIDEKNEKTAVDLLKNIATGAISSGIWSIGSAISNFLSTQMY